MEKSMMDVMYEIPSDESITECVVTEGSVDGDNPPLIVHKEQAKRLKSAR